MKRIQPQVLHQKARYMSKSKKKFYVVRRGRKPGIYTQWSGAEGAEAQVSGFQGAQFRGFETPAEAAYYLKTGEALVGQVEEKQPDAKPSSPSYQTSLDEGKVVIFTDGASTGNPGPGGYGAVLLYKDQRRELSGGYRCTTNNRMELLACIVALKSLTQGSDVVLFSDSRYVVNAVNLGWARRWKANNWLRSTRSAGEPPKAENVDLWQELLNLLDQHQVAFNWVKGHASSPENERCDRLAVAAARRAHLPEDPGYPSSQC